MELMTVTQVTQAFAVSTRMLRHYEKLGLLASQKRPGYAYRMYDMPNLMRLEQILVLRKLRIPLEQIRTLLENPEPSLAVEIFVQNLAEVRAESDALATIGRIVQRLIDALGSQAVPSLRQAMLQDEVLLQAASSLSAVRKNLQEGTLMEELNVADAQLNKLKNVRILHLPPATVAASHFIGPNPEENAGSQLDAFVRQVDLYHLKPDARVFGFNHPNPSEGNETYGYEVWVTIPDDLPVPAPLVKKRMEGGLYAAHTITLGAFQEWNDLLKWVVEDNPKYEAHTLPDGGECMGGLLEEHLNYVYHSHLGWPDSDEHQLDLLFPVKLK